MSILNLSPIWRPLRLGAFSDLDVADLVEGVLEKLDLFNVKIYERMKAKTNTCGKK